MTSAVDAGAVALSRRERVLIRLATAFGLALVSCVVGGYGAQAAGVRAGTVVALGGGLIAVVASLIVSQLGRRAVMASIPVGGVRVRTAAFDAFTTGRLSGDPVVDGAARALAATHLRPRLVLLGAGTAAFGFLGVALAVRGLVTDGWGSFIGAALMVGTAALDLVRYRRTARSWEDVLGRM